MENINIDRSYYEAYDVKRGLRNADGTGVMAGITRIGNVRGYFVQDGERVPMEGAPFLSRNRPGGTRCRIHGRKPFRL
jgi:hypothetical protein